MKTRREFIRDTCAACLGSAFLGVTISSCSPLPIFKASFNQHSVAVPLDSFAKSNLVLVRDNKIEYDILAVKKSETEYLALYLKCTHRSNPVTVTKSGLYCPTHGSRFDLDGNVTKEPAQRPLQRFATTIEAEHLMINLNS